MPPKSTQLRLEHFDELIYSALDPQSTKTSLLAKLIDALCGDAGAGSLKKQVFLQRLSASLDNIYGSDLDYVFGGIRFLSRSESESYAYDPTKELTSEQWDQIATKDAAYRARIREYFIACGKGNTPEGIRQVAHAATSSDCQVMETWRYVDSFGMTNPVGRDAGQSFVAVDLLTGHQVHFPNQTAANAFVSGKTGWQVQARRSRSEFTVIPHKQGLTAKESRLLLQMLRRVSDISAVVTLSSSGMVVSSPVRVRAVAADSTYFQVEKVVTGAPVLEELPAPEVLAIDLDPYTNWLRPNSPELAPYSQFNITQEYGYYYLVSGGRRSPIDSVTYGTLQEDGSVKSEPSLQWYEQAEEYGPWTAYDKADSPDNYPGGKFGLTKTAPALNPDRSPYQFPYSSQQQYVSSRKAEIFAMGGLADDTGYRMPIRREADFKRFYTPDLAVAHTAPASESTVTTPWMSRSPRFFGIEPRNPSLFVRS